MANNALVTGGLGFIGSHVVDLLIDKGYAVTVLDDLSTGSMSNANPKATLVIGSITDHRIWERLTAFDSVFHLASLARIQPSIRNPLPAHEVNLTGTLRVLEYCRQHKAKIIFSSSSSLYEGVDIPTNEDGKQLWKSPYSLQKAACEAYIKLYGELYGLDYAILRYFNVFGERQILTGDYAAVVGILLNQKKHGQPMTITHDGEQRRDFTYVKDIALANYMALNWGGVTNIGTGVNYSINQLADAIGGKRTYIGDRQGEARHTQADNSLARSLGWEPTTSIIEWIEGQKTYM